MSMKRRQRAPAFARALVGAVLAALVLALVAPMVVHAHAYLVEASPAANEELAASPAEVALLFSEPIAPAFSEITVLNARGDRVDGGGARVPDDEPDMLRLPLPELPDGTYTVTWRNVSNVDGHPQRGWYVFSVGEQIDPGVGLEPDAAGTLTSPFDPPVRWLTLMGALLLTGGVVFDRAIARPALGRLRDNGAGRELRARHGRWSRRIVVGGAAAWAAGTLLHLPVQLSVASGGLIDGASAEAVRALLLETRWGQAWLARIVLLAVAVVLLRRWLRGRGGTLALAVVVLAALLSHSVASHGGALTALRPAGISTDFLHLVAASVWVGGLMALLALIRDARATLPADESRALLGRVVPRFSVLGVLSVGTLAATGLFLAWMHVHEPGALDTPYGWTLLAKSALFLLALAIAAVNLLWTSGEAARSERGGRWIHRLVSAEAGLAVLIIVAVGLMTSMEPARSAAEIRDGARVFEERVDDVDATLRVEPGTLGTNRVEVVLEDRRGEPIPASSARLRITYLETDLGDVTVETEPVGEEGGDPEHGEHASHLDHKGAHHHFGADGVIFGVAGTWRVEVVATRLDGFDVRAPFLFEVGTEQAAGGPPLPVITARMLWIALWVALAALFHGVALRVRGRHSVATSALQWSGSAFIVAAVLVATNTQPFRMERHLPAANPLPASAQVLARGAEVYQQHCAVCHGPEGAGDGPQGPAAGVALDLRMHVPLHTDRELYGYIVNGIPATAMPAFGDMLTEDDAWSVMHHLRRISEGGADRLRRCLRAKGPGARSPRAGNVAEPQGCARPGASSRVASMNWQRRRGERGGRTTRARVRG